MVDSRQAHAHLVFHAPFGGEQRQELQYADQQVAGSFQHKDGRPFRARTAAHLAKA